MESILDLSKPVDVAAFDNVVQMLSSSSVRDVMRAQEVITEFKNNPDAFYQVDRLLTGSSNVKTRFLALQILDDTIIHRWNTLDEANQQGIRNFLINLIVQECTSFDAIRANRTLLTKMNSTLVSIAKREWPLRWPNFVQDIATSAGPDVPMVENNLNILRLVGEEVFLFGSKTLTSRSIQRKREALSTDFGHVMNLCGAVLMTAADTQLLHTALDTLEAYIPWMTTALVFQEPLLQRLSALSTGDGHVRTAAVRCLTEVCNLRTDGGAAGDAQGIMVCNAVRTTVESVLAALPTTHSSVMERLVALYESGNPVDQDYVSQLNLLLVAFLKRHVTSIAYDDAFLLSTHQLVLGMSHVMDKEVFKSCVEYWNWLGEYFLRAGASSKKKELMAKLHGVISDVRYALIKRMAKPEEVIIVEEEGEVRREQMRDVAELQMYELMKDTLVFLSMLDPADTRKIMVTLMKHQMDGSEWSWHNCNTLSWAVGAVSMAMSESEEKELFTNIIKGLLYLFKMMGAKEDKAFIASDIMFVVGQYPRYLRNHLSFLNIVVSKVFEFMYETFPGVQDMAVDTFIKLTKQVAPSMVDTRSGTSLANTVAEQWARNTKLLNPQQLQTSFIGVGHIVAAEVPANQGRLLETFLGSVNSGFKELTNTAAQAGPSFCQNADWLQELLHYMRVFSSVASTCHNAFIHEMNYIINDLYGFYRLLSDAQSSLAGTGSNVANVGGVSKLIRLSKKEVLRVFEHFVQNTEEYDFIAAHCLPELFNVVLTDYQQAQPAVKEPGALALTTACVNTLGSRLAGDCAAILDTVFNTTVAMIADNLESYPEFRVNLFKLILALNEKCFDAFVDYAASHEDVIGGLLWAIKHKDYPTMSTGLEALDVFVENVANSSFAEVFFTAYLQRIMEEVMVNALDSFHASGFELQCSVLRKLFAVSSMYPPSQPAIGRDAITAFLTETLSVLPTLQPATITAFIEQCYTRFVDGDSFSTFFADFLIEVEVWGAEQENKMLEEEQKRARDALLQSGYAGYTG